MTDPATPLEPDVRAYAHEYADLGLRVLPIKPGEKRPPMPAWQEAATTEPTTIDSWWTQLYRDHGIGIATGRASGIFVLDVDVSGGKVGDETLADLEATYSPLPETPTVVTGSGGRHYYFRHPLDRLIRNDAGKRLGPGLDIRGEGGQVVAPPTMGSLQRYEWELSPLEVPIAHAPGWLLALLEEPTPAPAPAPSPTTVDAGDSIAALFNERTTWAELLTRDGWTLAATLADGEQRWTRPGKDTREGMSATTGHGGGDYLKVFTSSVPQLEQDRAYSRFGYEAAMRHGGDRSACARALRAQEGPSAPQIASWTPPDLTEPPLPLEVTHRFGPPFPIDALPKWIADQCREVAHAYQVPIDLPAMLALGCLATLCTGKIKVNLTGSAWTEHVNLYLVSALLPGSGKSPVFKAMTKPVVEVEEKSTDRARTERSTHEAMKRLLDGKVKAAEAAAVKAPDTDVMIRGEYLDAVAAAERHRTEAPPAGQLIAEDITPEALVEVLAENAGRMALLSSEGGVFDMMAGQYVDKGKATNLAVYLQGWSGDPVRRKRTKAEAQTIPEALLNVCVTTQPGVIKALGANRELVTKGVPVRFMYSIPPSLVGFRDRHRVFDDMDATIGDLYRRRMVEIGLACLDAPSATVLQFTTTVAGQFTDWDQTLEERQKPSGDLAERAEWVAKLRATVMRLCGLLHVADGRTGQIDVDTLTCALRIADYWLAHADVVEAMWRSDQSVDKARTIVQWAIETKQETFTLRDAFTAKRGSFPTVADLVEPMQTLVDRGWIEPLQDGPVRALGAGKAGQQFRLRSDAARWLTDAQPTQPTESDEVARIARIARKGMVQTPPPYTTTFSAPETHEPPTQYAQPTQLEPTGTDLNLDFF